MEVFWRKGYAATSMQDLLEAMALSKSSLYQAFGSKKDLFEQCLAHYGEVQAQRLRSMLDQAPSAKAFLGAAVKGMIQEAGKAQAPKGCLLFNTATEFSRRDPAIADRVEEGLSQFAEVFRRAIERGQRDGEFASGRDPVLLARYVMTTISGLRTMIKAGLPRETAQQVADVALNAV